MGVVPRHTITHRPTTGHHRKDNTMHDPYIMWLRRTKTPIARCHDCTWHTITTPFQSAAEHLKEGK